jgi:hypothetical protein
MKAKTLLIAAAALAAGVMHSQAQVYSQNIVGYVNVPLTNSSGYTLISNPLDLDGTGTNNTIYTTVGTNLPAGTIVEAWTGSSFKLANLNGATWSSAANANVVKSQQPGNGFFIYVPTPTNVTFVGNVIQGTNSYPVIAGYQIVSSSSPVAGRLEEDLLYTPTLGDVAEVWTGSTFKLHTFNGGVSWSGGGDPNLTVGAALFLNSASNTNWTQVLNVQ